MKITIKLLSDLCTSSGETYNSLVDTDVVYDTYGLPYIPAKRIKGCIREAAIEMKDMGLIKAEDFSALFGKEGHSSSGFTLSNAYLQDYSDAKAALTAYQQADFVSQQAVLDIYTSMRTQTAVNLETGVAEENSLRTARVVNKGLVFEAYCNIKNQSLTDRLKEAVSLVKHMGISRSRGLGLVEMRLEEGQKTEAFHVLIDKGQLKDKNKLRYTISLKSAMICKSAQGNQAKTQDYIAGSKVLGIIAGAMGSEKYQQLTVTDELIVSNAYIVNNGKRCQVGPVSLQKEKDHSWLDGTMTLLDMRYRPDVTGKQMTPANIAYLGEDGSKVDVVTEISYHHRRPDDKSIGRATGDNDGSSFYQLCSISPGQNFSGYIYASYSQAEEILEAVKNLGPVRMGYGKSSEFGAVDFTIDLVEAVEATSEMVHEAAVTLVSDMILYNEAGFLSTELSVLGEYLNEVLGVKDITIENPFLVFTTVGGYNVTWKARKPIFTAFAKGTSFIIKSATGFDVNILNNTFIGERVAEGYGELIASKLSSSPEVMVKKPCIMDFNKNQSYGDADIIQTLLQTEFDSRLQKEIMDLLDKNKGIYKNKPEGFNAAVAKLRVMYKNETSYEAMQDQVNGIEGKDKQGLCSQLLKLVDPSCLKKQISAGLESDYNLSFDLKKTDQELFKYVYGIYIAELKHFAKTLNREGVANGR